MFSIKRKKEKIKLSKESWKKSKKLISYLKSHSIKFSIGMVFLILSSLASMVFPGLVGKLIDAKNQSNDSFFNLESINNIALLLFLLFFLNAIFSYFRIYIFSDVTENILAKLRQNTYKHMICLPMTYFSKQRVGELNSRISADIGVLQETFTTVIAEFIRQIIIIILGLILLFFYSWKLTLIMLCSLPIMILIAVFFGKFIKKLSKDTQEKISNTNIIVEETLTAINNVKAFANEFFEINRYKAGTEQIRKVAMKGAKWRGAFASFIIFALFGSIVLIIWQGIILKEAGEIEMGDLFSFILYSVFVGVSLGGTADLFARIQKAVGATERLFDILDEKIEKIEIRGIPDKIKIKGEIEFKNVSFHYETRQDIEVLKNINFSVSVGENLALVGHSGAGKSTLISLIMRFFDQTSGQILLDGKELKDYDLTSYRSQIAFVPQEVILFGGTIKENIGYGDVEASDNQIEQAAKQANALEFIEKFPEKFETIVGERGIQLSGGQRQRIAIARAILRNPKILILDEATSSLDSENEKMIKDALENLMKDRTSIVIAHRLSTIRKANNIIVMSDGQIKETGNHEKLIQIKNGIYSNMNKLQIDESL